MRQLDTPGPIEALHRPPPPRAPRWKRIRLFILLKLLRVAPDSWKGALCRLAGANVSPDAAFSGVLSITGPPTGDLSYLTVAPKAFLGSEVMLDLLAPITLGYNASLSPRVTILTHADPGPGRLLRGHFPRKVAPVEIADEAWVGAGALILPGVRIGVGAVVAAGAVVVRDVPDHTVVAGIPARPIRRLSAP